MPGLRLAAACGAVRDGAAGVESFAHLLGSRRVGPRGVALALPEVREGCAALCTALDSLAEAIRGDIAEDTDAADAACAVIASAHGEATRLCQELAQHGGPAPASGRGGRGGRGGAERSSIDARQRLALETSVRRTARELAGALYLVDLVIATLEPRPTPLNLVDVLREQSSAAADGQQIVQITATYGAEGAAGAPAEDDAGALYVEDSRANELDGDVRIVSGLVELAVGLVHAAGLASPHVRGYKRADGRFRLSVGQPGPREAASSLALGLTLRDGGARSAAIARVVARRSRIDLDVVEAAGGCAVTMTI